MAIGTEVDLGVVIGGRIYVDGELSLEATGNIHLIGSSIQVYGKRIISVANAVAGTDALNQDTGDARYLKRLQTVVIKTGDYTAAATDDVIICNKGTAMTITLPAATGSGQVFTIKNIGAGAVTVDGNSADTIDGETTQLIEQWTAMKIVDYAANAWAII